MKHDSIQIQCPRCSVKLVVASDAENPFHRCGRCGAVFSRVVERKPGNCKRDTLYLPDEDVQGAFDIDSAEPAPWLDARRPAVTVPLVVVTLIGVVWFANQWQVEQSLTARVSLPNVKLFSDRSWTKQLWEEANVDAEYDDEGRVMRLTFRPGTDPSQGLSMLGPLAPHVREIDLSETALNELHLQLMHSNLAPQRLTSSESLQSLNLKGCDVGDDALRTIAGLPDLVELGLSQTQITDRGLAHLRGHPHLKKLYVGDTAVGDEGMTHLAGLTAPEILNLRNTQVGDDGLKHLRGLSNLTYLYLAGTRVSDRSIDYFQSLSGLEGTNLFETQVTSRGISRLKSMLPRTVVVHNNP